MIRLSLPNGICAMIHPRGATLAALYLPDRDGRLDDVLLGPEQPGTGPRQLMGAMAGRYANRIAGAAFTLDGTRHRLDANDGAHCLHGGARGFDLFDWTVTAQDGRGVTLRLVSPDGDQGFPGRMESEVTYRLDEPAPGAARLSITMTAICDRATPVSLTNHAYFNLGGTGDPSRLRGIDDHWLSVAAARYLPVGPDAIPLPEAPAPVDGTPFDWRDAARIGDRLRLGHPQLRAVRGVDHCFCLDGTGFHAAATLADPGSGRSITLWTDQPGVQVYTANWLDGTAAGKGGAAYRMGDAICLEPGAWPDAPNRPDFPSAILRPGAQYRHQMALIFPPPA